MRLLLFTATLVLVLPSFNHVAVAADATNAIVFELDRATLIKLRRAGALNTAMQQLFQAALQPVAHLSQ